MAGLAPRRRAGALRTPAASCLLEGNGGKRGGGAAGSQFFFAPSPPFGSSQRESRSSGWPWEILLRAAASRAWCASWAGRPVRIARSLTTWYVNAAIDFVVSYLQARERIGGERQSHTENRSTMIGWSDVYKVAAATVPLYFALFLGYGSVRWWRIFTKEQCDAVNRLVAFFALPFFTFEFTLHTDPFQVNYRAVAADVISKAVIVAVIACWARFAARKGAGCAVGWSITSFSLSTLTNSLVVGVPMARAMYGEWAQQLVVQLSVFQAIVWLTLLLFVLEVRKAAIGMYVVVAADDSPVKDVETCSTDATAAAVMAADGVVPVASGKPSLCALVKVVAHKLSRNPNTYASFVGITWACVANRLHIELPSAFEGSVLIMSKSGTGMAMFSMGLFMAQQEKVLVCGPCFAALGLVLKFALGPAAMAIGSIAVGLRGDVLRVAIIQAALPQSITSFIFAKEYGMHADVLSTAVIFGMLVSLPLLVGFYIVLELIR